MTLSRIQRTVSFCAASAMLFVACSSASDANTDTAEPAETADSARGSIRVWTHDNDAFNDSLEGLAADFTAANPDVDVTFRTFDYDTYVQILQSSFPAGNDADVLQLFGSWTCGYAENLNPVPSGISTLAAAQDRYFASAIDGYTCDDQLYGFPMESNIEYGAGIFNRAIAEEVGVDLDAGWDTWDDLIADAVAMTQGGPDAMTRAGLNFVHADGIAAMFLANIVQQGGSYLSEDGSAFTFDTAEGAASLELMEEIVGAGAVDPVAFADDSYWIGDCFFEEVCASGIIGPWVLGNYTADFPDVAANTEFVQLPLFDGATEPNYVADSGWGLAVSGEAQNALAAWAFVAFVTASDENAMRWNTESGTVPAVKSNAQGVAGDELVAEFPQFGPFLEVLPFGQYVGDVADRDLLFYDIIYPHVNDVLLGIETAEAALASMEQEANESL